MNYNTNERKGKVVSCSTCEVKVYKAPSELKKSVDGRYSCGRKCSNELRSTRIKESLEDKLGISDLKEWLEQKYHVERMNTREMAELAYGSGKNKSNISGWMKRLGVEIRSRSEAVAMQWEGNEERRAMQAERTVKYMGAGTPAREKLIRIMQTEEYKRKQSISKTGERNGMYGVTGEAHPQWNGGKTREQRLADRKLPETTKWRASVFQKDNHTCQCCGYSQGGTLVAHHLNGYNWDVENRFNPDNGVTLCETCHIEFHRLYGYGNNTRKQFEMFLIGEKPKNYKEQLALF